MSFKNHICLQVMLTDIIMSTLHTVRTMACSFILIMVKGMYIEIEDDEF